MHKAIFALVILLLSLTASANASQLDDAVTAVHNGDYALAHQLLRELAEKGDARAQFNIGCMYANGWGVPRNNTEAAKWYHGAANQGLAIAQHFLGIAYAYGEGVEPDVVEAAKGLRDFAKAHPALIIKGGYLDGHTIDAAEVAKLADLESREVLLAMLAGAMKASMANAAATLNALPVQMARLAGALQAKLEAEGGATAPADTAPADTAESGADQAPADTPNDEPAAPAAADEDPSTEE